MLYSPLIPHFLAITMLPYKFSNDFKAEYNFDYNKTIVVHREPVQVTETTAKLTCLSEPTRMYCVLRNITISSIVKYHNVNGTKTVIDEVSKRHLNIKQWFVMYFNENRIEKIMRSQQVVKADEVEYPLARHIILSIVNQFNLINGDNINKMENAHTSGASGKNVSFSLDIWEPTPLGECRVKYNGNVKQEDKKKATKFRIIPATTLPLLLVNATNARIRLEKARQQCIHSTGFKNFLNNMVLDDYKWLVETYNDGLNISTTMDVILPADEWHPNGQLVFNEKVQLTLKNVTSPPIVTEPREWINFN
ncbi:PREDICTED: uncharacterized protein LOC105570450 [Vollenhovia emeryi]|uniref:uncharacterized protein LOC105570450 n=1 Tax=Vollenhovia emeryi TaxID=411798 RepID=UPI0005F4A8F3|nr:PREDICTED: uncharacterized protein LOC105570450 [Vollenhovia emeryi]XP_011883037.1 PREDICTED: uncharacterized protein LOC105570450 [Vollenhovia emeryi]XP_011883038.1 PREDICTED: uncharacterized protein LOC105570450 [Vollenhovia emeryi]